MSGPMLRRWEARAAADAMHIEAQAKADSIGIIAAAQAEARDTLDTPQTSTHAELDIGDEIRARITFQEEKRQRNIESVVRRAAEQLGDKDVQDNDIDHDWTATFFAEVQDVSSEKMQEIWARILAGEVEQMGKTSMRTLSILKTLSQNDAELFQNSTRFILAGFTLKDDSFTKNVPNFPSYADFMQLSHHGLFQLGTGLQINFQNQSEYHFVEEDVVCRIFKDNVQSLDLSIPAHLLSPSGREIANIVSQHKSDDYIHVVARFVHQKYREKLAYARLNVPDGTRLSEAPSIEVDPNTPFNKD